MMSNEHVVSSESGLSWDSASNFKIEKPDGTDRVFAWIYLLIGYGFIYAFSSIELAVNMAVFTVLYTSVVTGYIRSKGIKPEKESYFWMSVLLAVGLPYAFWSVMPFLQLLALIILAAYWTLHVTGSLIQGSRTSQWAAIDCLNALAIIPFKNFTCQLKVLRGSQESGAEKKTVAGRLGAVMLGLAISLPILLIVFPVLSSADAGFQALTQQGYLYIQEHFMMTIVRVVLAVPVAAYLFGIVYGGIYKHNTNRIEPESVRATGRDIRVVPDTAVCTAVVAVCLVYLLFMIIQGRYLFSAFWGTMPEEFTYAEYARRGFFELCGIAGLNLVLLFCADIFTKTERKHNNFLRVLNIILSVLTLLLIMTAMSKMVMYIIVYGFTVKRILTMSFMIWLTLTFSLVIVWQKREIPVVRICVMAGAVIFSLLCIIPIENILGI